MRTYELPGEPEWLVIRRKAAYCAHHRINGGADSLTAVLYPESWLDQVKDFVGKTVWL